MVVLTGTHLLRSLVLERLVQSNDVHREAEYEYREHRQEPGQVLHQVTDDDSPRAEQVVEREEVEDLDTSEEEGDSEQLVAEIHERGPVQSLDSVSEKVESDTEDAEQQDRHLDPAESALVTGVGEF